MGIKVKSAKTQNGVICARNKATLTLNARVLIAIKHVDQHQHNLLTPTQLKMENIRRTPHLKPVRSSKKPRTALRVQLRSTTEERKTLQVPQATALTPALVAVVIPIQMTQIPVRGFFLHQDVRKGHLAEKPPQQA